jgi:hypothetical protein
LGDPKRAEALHQAFMRLIVANFDNTWEITSADVDAYVMSLPR